MAEQPVQTDPPSPQGREPQFGLQAPLRRLRVVWVAGTETLERMERVLQPLAIGLMDELVELIVLCPEGIDTQELPSPPIQIMRYGRIPWLAFRSRTVRSIAGQLQDKRVALLHALDAEAAGLTARLAVSADLPYVLGSFSLDDGPGLRSLVRRPAAVLAASEPIRQNLLEHHVAPVEKLLLVRPGVYQVRHATCFNNPQHSIAIVAGGELGDYDAFDAALRTFAELVSRDYDCSFFVIGNGPAEKPLRARAEELGLRRRLSFADRQRTSQMAGILKAADIYIAPCTSPSIDFWSLLALAAGDPVLSGGPGASDFIIDDRTAVTFGPGNSSELIAKLTALLADRAATRALMENALGYLREHHSPAQMVAKVAQTYRQVVMSNVGAPSLAL